MQLLKRNSVVAAITLAFGLAAPFVAMAAGPATIDLSSSASFAILAKTGVSTTGTTAVVGDVGVSPAAATYITGFALNLPASGAYSTSALVTGKVYAPGYASPTPVNLTSSVGAMETAYTDGAGRSNPTATELGAGNIGGMTLAPGLYKWGTGVTIPSDVTLSGGMNDVWIFQIAQDLTVSASKKVILSGGAQASNVFWVVAGTATIGTTAVMNGTILSKTVVVLNTGAALNGRALAQTAVTLDASTVTIPGATSAPAPVTPAPTAPAPTSPAPVSPAPVSPTPVASFDRAAQTSAASSINADKGFMQISGTASVVCPPNTLVKGSGSAVYYCGNDGKRYVFTSSKVYYTWYPDFSTVNVISDSLLGSIAIGGNVTYRPGVRLIKIQSDPKVYAVSAGGTLRWVQTEAIARALYGDSWNTFVEDVSDAFFVNYTMGAAITSAQ